MSPAKEDALHCSFCGKSQNEVEKIIAGPAVSICNECVDICNEILADEREARAAQEAPPEGVEIGRVICPHCHAAFALYSRQYGSPKT